MGLTSQNWVQLEKCIYNHFLDFFSSFALHKVSYEVNTNDILLNLTTYSFEVT